MRKSIVAASLIAGAVVALANPLPASARRRSGDTPVTFAVTSGTLDITVPAGPVSLGYVTASTSTQTLTTALGNVTVTDGRGTTGWVVTANGVDFTGPQSISVLAAGSSSYPGSRCHRHRHRRRHRPDPPVPAGARADGHRRLGDQHRRLGPDHLRHDPGERPGRNVQLDDHPLRRLIAAH